MKLRGSFLLFVSFGLVYSCPKPEELLASLKGMGVPIGEIKKVSPFKEVKELCLVEGILKERKKKKEVIFFVSQDGKYMFPFAGRVVYKPTPVGCIKEVEVVGLGEENRTMVVGYVTSDLKFFFPQMVELPKKDQNKTAQGEEEKP